ncbi:hypothetical protein EJD97_004434, partial [Solanum chilense]
LVLSMKEFKSDRDIMGIVPKLKNGDIVELYATHLVEEDVVAPPAIEYLNDVGWVDGVGGESNATFDKESSQSFQDSKGLGFEEPAKPIVGEELSEVFRRTSTSAGEELGRASASGEEDLGGTSFAVVASDIQEVGFDWESEIEGRDDSDNADLSDEGEDEYGNDVHE